VPKLRPAWEAKFRFGVTSGEPDVVGAGSVCVALCFGIPLYVLLKVCYCISW